MKVLGEVVVERASVPLRIAFATVLGFAATMVAARLDARFQPVFASWMSAEMARVPYDTAAGDTLLAGLLAGTSFLFLLLGAGAGARPARSARVLALVAVGITVFTVARVRSWKAREPDAVELATIPGAADEDPGHPRCGKTWSTPGAASSLTSTILCTNGKGARVDQIELRQRRDDLVVAAGGRALLVERVCATDGVGATCRWRATASPDPSPSAPASVIVDLATIARPANADDALSVAWLPAFNAFRVRDPSGQSWTFDAATGREMQGPLLEGHRPGSHSLGRLAVLISIGGTVVALLFLALMEDRLRWERRYALSPTGTVRQQQVMFTDGSTARIVDGVDLAGAVTRSPRARPDDAEADARAAYRDPEILRRADLVAGTALDLAAAERRKATVLRALLLATVAVTVAPVAVDWVRSGTSLPPLPLAPVDLPLTQRS